MKTIIHIRARHWFLLFTATVLTASLLLTGERKPASAGEQTFTGKAVILIDPGHGGFDGGAVGANGTIEKDVNLAVSLKLRELLTDAGFEVVMTRDSDCALDDAGASTIRRRKVSDMRARLNLTRLYPGSVLISIHQNKLSEDSRVRGFQSRRGSASLYRRVSVQGRLLHLPRTAAMARGLSEWLTFPWRFPDNSQYSHELFDFL